MGTTPVSRWRKILAGVFETLAYLCFAMVVGAVGLPLTYIISNFREGSGPLFMSALFSMPFYAFIGLGFYALRCRLLDRIPLVAAAPDETESTSEERERDEERRIFPR